MQKMDFAHFLLCTSTKIVAYKKMLFCTVPICACAMCEWKLSWLVSLFFCRFLKTENLAMYCTVCFLLKKLFKHYRLKHGSCARTIPIPCLHTDRLWTRNHSHEVHNGQIMGTDEIPVIFHCPLCHFEEPCTELTFFHICASILKIRKLWSVYMKTAFLRAMSTQH